MILTSITPSLIYINLLQCEPGFYTTPRVLKNPYFLFVHKGKGVFNIGDIDYEANEGDLFFCPRNVKNTIWADKVDPFLLTGVDFYFYEPHILEVDSLPYKTKIQVSDEKFTWLINEMVNEYNSHKKYHKEYLNSLLRAFLFLVLRFSEVGNTSSQIDIFTNYIKKNPNRTILAEELGKKFNYHPYSINRIFKVQLGITLRQYQIELRMKQAAQLLLYTQYSIEEIAFLCGYENTAYFSRIFKIKNGISPLCYRRIKQGNRKI